MPTKQTPRSLAELEQAVLDGDTTITADELAAARAAAALAELHAQADVLAEQRSAAEQLEQDRAEFRAEYSASHAKHLAAARAAYRAFVEAAPKLTAAVVQLNRTIRAGEARARQLGIGDEIDDRVLDTGHYVARALDEAAGRYLLIGSSAIPRSGPIRAQRLIRHALHDPALADRIDADLLRQAQERRTAMLSEPPAVEAG